MLIVYIYINLVKLNKNNLVQISRITFFWDEKEIKGNTYTSVPTIKGETLFALDPNAYDMITGLRVSVYATSWIFPVNGKSIGSRDAKATARSKAR